MAFFRARVWRETQVSSLSLDPTSILEEPPTKIEDDPSALKIDAGDPTTQPRNNQHLDHVS